MHRMDRWKGYSDPLEDSFSLVRFSDLILFKWVLEAPGDPSEENGSFIRIVRLIQS